MFSIYILRLEDNKYYVGKTNNIKKRIKQHKESYGSSWTKKYKFIEMIDVIETNEHFLEDMYVKKYMNRYGINNVRGGSYSRVLLSYEHKQYYYRKNLMELIIDVLTVDHLNISFQNVIMFLILLILILI